MTQSPYIIGIRRYIGTRLLLVPTVAVLPRDAQGRLLLVRQRDTRLWSTIGGIVEIDETPEYAAIREAQEEARVQVRLDRLIGVFGGPQFRLTYLNGDRVACVAVAYEASVVSGNPAPDDHETCEVGWFHDHELHALHFNDLNQNLLAKVLDERRRAGSRGQVGTEVVCDEGDRQ